MSTDRPDLGTVVVSYNTRDLLDRCLASLAAEIERAALRAEVWVVDNASSDGSADMVADRYPWIHLVARNENVGFAAANNVALDQWARDPDLTPEWVLVLNPDTELNSGTLAALVAALSAAPDAAVAGPALRYPDGRFQHSAFRFPGFVQTALDLFPVPRLMDHPVNGRYPRARYRAGVAFTVDFPLGACMMVRGSALAHVGTMDTGYFMYCEEIDWCRRFRSAGYRVLCVPGATVFHHAAASTRQFRGAMFTALWRSRLRYFARHEPPHRRAGLTALVRWGLATHAFSDRIAVAWGRLDPDEAADRAAAYRAIFAARAP